MAHQQHARPEPTEDELRAAWRRAWRKTWPDTFEASMADPLLARLVKLEARHPNRGSVVHRTPVHRPDVTPWSPAPAPAPHHQGAFAPPVPRTPPGLDRMRRAAGERDDD